MLSNKWELLEETYEQLSILAEQELPEESSNSVREMLMRMRKIAELSHNVNEEEIYLKNENMKLFKQKGLYAQKLNDIVALGSNLDWDERSGIMRRIRPSIQAAQGKMRSDAQEKS